MVRDENLELGSRVDPRDPKWIRDHELICHHFERKMANITFCDNVHC